jgi:monosaccharide-transporting ATPase
MMVGRSVGEIERDGATTFSDEGHVAAAEPLLRAEGLTSTPKLSDVSVAIRPGEVVGLAGLLGSGRSETARAIVGAFPLQSGTVYLAGKALRPTVGAAVRSGVAMLAEDRKADGIIGNLSVRENIVLAALPRLSRFGVVSRARQDRIVETFMRRLRIKASSPDQPVAELSGGNQQKVLLARWLATEPQVLLLDEPTRGIDVGAKADVYKLLETIKETGVGIVVSSSEVPELLLLCDRILVMHRGRVAAALERRDANEGLITHYAMGHA